MEISATFSSKEFTALEHVLDESWTVSKPTTYSFMTDKEAPQVTLSEFSQVSSTIIQHVIKASSTKSRALDPIPTQLLKDHLELIVPVAMFSSLSQTFPHTTTFEKTRSRSGEPEELQTHSEHSLPI